ncbi:MAG: type II toxin-antitoxin system VapC family toxin [Gemmataceae bacterium]|nr:type II toxin-antitoxin system VapC family toxin [Gemmataceae bacterium]
MKLLIDTHTLLWHTRGDPQMSRTAAALVTDPNNALFLSMASVWELAIKSGLGKLSLAGSYPTFVTQAIQTLGLTVLPVTFDDCVAFEQLPFPDPRHRDPFDRMIVVHAQRNGLSVVGADASFDPYGVPRLW